MELLPGTLAGPIKDRMTLLIESVQTMFPETINIGFASQRGSDASTPDERRFHSLWIFTDRYMGEIRDPLSAGQRWGFDVAILFENVDYIRLVAQNFEAQTAVDGSLLSLEFSTKDGLNGEISAVGAGCNDLMRLYVEQFKANIYKPSEK